MSNKFLTILSLCRLKKNSGWLFTALLILLHVSIMGQNCSVNSGVDFTSCPNVAINLVGNKSGLFQGAGITTWSQVDGPSVTIDSPNSLTSAISGVTPNTVYKFSIQATCADGSLVTDIVTVSTNPLTIPNAGPDAMYCPGNYTLAANTPGTGETGQWTVVGTNNGVTISTPASPISNIILDGNKAGATTLRWTISNATTGCSAYDDVVISNKGGITIVTAGSDQTLSGCYSSTTAATLGSSFAGNGTGGQGGLWSCVSGPSAPTFANATVYNTTVSNLKEGVYTIRWTVSGTCANGVDDLTITVVPPKGNVTNAILTSGDQTFCDGRTSAVLVGNTPLYANETVIWEKVTGVGTITSVNTPTTTVTGLTGNSTSTYKYYITNPLTGCTSISTIKGIYYTTAPTITVNGGNDVILAPNATSASIPFTVNGGNTTQYTIISYPDGYTPPSWTAASSPQTISGLNKVGTYVARFKRFSNSSVGGCSEAYDDVIIYVSQSPTGANAGTDQLLACIIDNTALAGNNPTVGTGHWSQVSGPNTATIETPTLNNSNITGLISGKYVFRWTISAGNNVAPTQDEVNVVVASNVPTTANAGSDLNVCHSTPLILSGNIPALNETGTWTVNPSTGITFSDTHNPKATVTGLSASTAYTFTWTITNACGTSSDNAIITTSITQGPIQSVAGIDQCLASGTTNTTLAGNVPAPGTGLWTKISGPACTFTNAALYNTTVNGMTDGTYKLEWALTFNSCSVSRDTVVITISAPATTANAGVDQNICGVSATLAGNTPAVGTGYWTQTVGNAGVTITDPTSPTSTITGLIDGFYTFRWTISNNACSSNYDDVIIRVSTPPTTADAGIDQTVCGTNSATLAANTITNGNGYWNVVSAPTTPTFSSNTSPTATISSLVMGTYTLQWVSQNGASCPISTDDIIITVTPTANAGANANICNQSELQLSGNAASTGTWTTFSGPNSPTINTTGGNTASVSGMIAGTYTFRYSISVPGCDSFDDMVVVNSGLATVADAGTNFEQCGGTTISLNGNAPAGGEIAVWSKASGPGGTTFSPNGQNATFTGASSGLYWFKYTIINGNCSSSSLVKSEVCATPTTANAGSDQNVCGYTTNFAGNTPTVGIGNWSQVSGPGTSNIESIISPTSSVTCSASGTYVFRWTISNGTCAPSTDDVTLNIDVPPTIPNAGADQNLCNLTSATLAGNTIVTGAGSWSQISGPNTSTITDSNDPLSTVTNLIAGTYVFRWTSTYLTCSAIDDVNINVYATPSTATSGGDLSICNYTTAALNGNTPAVGIGTWSQLAGPNTVTINNSNSPTSTLSGTMVGTYSFRWTIANGTCPSSSTDVNLTVNALPSIAQAGIDQSLCNVTSTTLAATTPTSGTGTWSKVSGPNNPVFVNANLVNTVVNGLIPGVYVLDWTVANGPCTSSDQVQVTIADIPTAANAGSDQIICGTNIATMDGNIPTVGVGTWTRISGPNTPTITSPNSGKSTITGLINGTYVFRWTISNSPCTSSSDDVQLQVSTSNVTVANAGVDQVGSAMCGLTSTTLAANSPTVGTGVWSIVSGSGGSFGNSSSPTSSFSGNADETYVLRWTITSVGCVSYDDVTVAFTKNPTVANAGTDQDLCNVTSITLTATAVTVGVGTWSVVSGPNTPTVINPNLENTTINGLITGVYVFDWTVVNGVCTSSDQVQVTIADIPTIANAGSDQIICGTNVATMSGNIPTIGIGTWTRVSGPNMPTITSPNLGTTSVTGLIDGTYIFRWTISNGSCTSSFDDVQLQVSTSDVTVANAGVDQTGSTLCGLTSTTLAANNPTVGTGAWSIVSGTGGSFGDAASNTSSFTGNAGDTYVLRWTITSVACVSTDDVTITFPKNPTTSDAGLDQSGSLMCGLTSTTLAGNTPAVGSGLWTIVSGTGGSFLDATNPTTTFTGTASTTYSLKWTISNSPCTSSESLVTVFFKEIPTVPTIGTITQPTCSVATGQVDLSGLPAVGTWTITPSLGIAATGSGTTYSFGGLTAATTYTFTVTNADGCTSVASANAVINSQPPTPVAPTASATLQPTCLVSSGTIEVSSSIAGLNFSTDGIDYTNSTGVFTGISAGNYTVTSKNSFGCISPATTNVTLIAPVCSDLSISKTVDNSNPDVGDDIVFTISVTNNGFADATGVKVTDVIPSGYSFVSDDAGGNYNSTTGLWTIGSLTNGSSTTLKITVTVNATGSYANTASVIGDQGDPVPGNNTSTNTPTPITISNLSIVKSVDNANPNVGDNVVFTLTATNNGPSDATGVKTTDVLASGYTYVSDNGSGSYNSTTGLWDIGDLANSSTSTLKITALVKASGNYANTATITGDQNDPILTDNSTTVTPVPIPQVNLAIVKTVDNSTPIVGGNVIFTLTVTNNGPSDATGVNATDILPSGYTYVSDNGGGDYIQSTGLWTIGSLSNGSSESLRITATVNATGSYANTTSVVGDQNDPVPGNNTSTNTPIPVPQCNLEIVKTVSSGTFNYGDNVTFTLTVTNHGPSSATGVKVTDVLPSGYAYVWDNGSGVYSHSNGQWTIGNLANGSTVLLSITVQVNDSGERINTATVTGDQDDPVLGNNTSSATPTIVDHTPIAVDDNAKTKIDEEVIITILNNDSGLEDTPLTISIATQPTHGTVVVNNDNTVTYKPALGYKGENVFTYQVCDVDGDCASANVYITIESELIIPDGFSPNGDGINDYFVIPDIVGNVKVKLEIVNRWGNLVYNSPDYKNNWDGKANVGIFNGSDLPTGTYFYVAKLIGTGKKFTGYIYLNR